MFLSHVPLCKSRNVTHTHTHIHLHKCMHAHTHTHSYRFVPDLEDIVEFGDMVQKADMSAEAVTAAKYASSL